MVIDPGLIALERPDPQSLPLVVTVPHAGRDYGMRFTSSVRLSEIERRGTEDCFADAFAARAPSLGAPLLKALFPRVWLDVNRDERELDPLLIKDNLPPDSLPATASVKAGLGVVPRLMTGGRAIHSSLLPMAEIEQRLALGWRPFHATLQSLIAETRKTFGFCLLIDCHSMPTSREAEPPDIVLGDNFGKACDARLTSEAERFFKDQGFRLAINKPYAGGYITRHYGQPENHVHALQIEISRSLYMNERRFEILQGLGDMTRCMGRLFTRLGGLAF